MFLVFLTRGSAEYVLYFKYHRTYYNGSVTAYTNWFRVRPSKTGQLRGLPCQFLNMFIVGPSGRD